MLEVVIPLQVNVYAMMADMTWIVQVIIIVFSLFLVYLFKNVQSTSDTYTAVK